jgi:signal transduction histidine kinase
VGIASTRRPGFSLDVLGVSTIATAACLVLGLVAVAFGLASPYLLPAALAPAIAVRIARRGWIQETEKVREGFLTTISHELRTPLTPIIGFTKFLLRREDVDPSTRREALASMLERAEHMQRLVEDLLLAAVVGGERSVHSRREPVDVVEVVARTMSSARTTHPDRDFVLETGSPILAVGDSLRLRQVVGNLLDNAAKYSPQDAPVLVRVFREGDEAVIEVADRGRGIPTDKQAEIFRRFRRLESPEKMETGGSGLGLFIVDQLVRAMGGTVTITSRPGGGSTFSVRLEAMAGSALPQRVVRPA